MPLVDDRGRLFGRINVIDLALLAFVIVLVPLGYAAFLVFRTPPPRITRLNPDRVVYNKGEQRIQVMGEHLRPFLKAALGTLDARAFIVERPDQGELRFIDVPPGTYDLTLFDESLEVTRFPKALTVLPPPQPPVQLVGHFVGAAGADLTAGGRLLRDRASVEIVTVGPPTPNRTATLRATCDLQNDQCLIGGTAIGPGQTIALQSPDRAPLEFAIGEYRIDRVWADVQVRLFGIPEVLDLMKPGDVDRHLEPEQPNPTGMIRGAVIASLDARQPTTGTLALNMSQQFPDPGARPASALATGYVPLQTRLAVLRVPLERTAQGWRYRDDVVRPGSAVTFETPDLFLRALILKVSVPQPAAAGEPR